MLQASVNPRTPHKRPFGTTSFADYDVHFVSNAAEILALIERYFPHREPSPLAAQEAAKQPLTIIPEESHEDDNALPFNLKSLKDFPHYSGEKIALKKLRKIGLAIL